MQKKYLTKFNTLSWWKHSKNTRTEENHLNMIKAICAKPTVNNIILNGEGLKAFIFYIKNKPPFTNIAQYWKVLSRAVQQEKEIEGTLIGKERVKLSLLQMI